MSEKLFSEFNEIITIKSEKDIEHKCITETQSGDSNEQIGLML